MPLCKQCKSNITKCTRLWKMSYIRLQRFYHRRKVLKLLPSQAYFVQCRAFWVTRIVNFPLWETSALESRTLCLFLGWADGSLHGGKKRFTPSVHFYVTLLSMQHQMTAMLCFYFIVCTSIKYASACLRASGLTCSWRSLNCTVHVKEGWLKTWTVLET